MVPGVASNVPLARVGLTGRRHEAEFRYRVFVSYSHQDLELVKQIIGILAENQLEPLWDESLLFGEGFDDQVKNFIAHAHLFLPVLTRTADSRKWVHQEIGYAMALNVPVIPLVVDECPGDLEMLGRLHALRVDRKDLSGITQHLTRENIERLVARCGDPHLALYACADYPEARASMIVRYCKDVLALSKHGLVKQKGGLSSFHIPTQTIHHHVWSERYGDKARSVEHCRLQREERLALTEHAMVSGCRLIVNPALRYEFYGKQARQVRLRCLLDFLEGLPEGVRCKVAINTEMSHDESVTIVGDWFVAKSVSARIGRGYFQTIYTRHAPNVREEIARFDEEFDELLAEANITAVRSRECAIERIREELTS